MRLAILLLCSALVFGQSATPPIQLPKAESPAGTADQISQNQDYGTGTGAHGRQMGALEVLSDTQGVDFGPYLQGILQDVKENWYRLIPESAAIKKGKLAIEFAITKDGKVAGMKLTDSSGDNALDRAAWGGITASNPFPALPSDFGGQYLALRFRFSYNPDKSELNDLKTADLIRTGNEYLNLGQDEKAMAAFDKALTIAATPPMWNSIAYRLSLKRSHLDRAQQYAESAVSATAANLHTLSLEKLNRRDLGNVLALASYWDTLGWVAFAGGKLDIAERYVSAAWQLGGDAEEADHLGQIYEKRENKSEAAHLYALAMNARRPEPETRSRLAALVGDGEVDAAIEKYRKEQLQARTLHLSNTPAVNGRADFFVLLSPGQGTTVTVESTSFVSGDENLKVLADSLRSAKFTQQFPDPSVKIVRRGTLDCKAAAECTFLLALPVDVKSVN